MTKEEATKKVLLELISYCEITMQEDELLEKKIKQEALSEAKRLRKRI